MATCGGRGARSNGQSHLMFVAGVGSRAKSQRDHVTWSLSAGDVCFCVSLGCVRCVPKLFLFNDLLMTLGASPPEQTNPNAAPWATLETWTNTISSIGYFVDVRARSECPAAACDIDFKTVAWTMWGGSATLSQRNRPVNDISRMLRGNKGRNTMVHHRARCGSKDWRRWAAPAMGTESARGKLGGGRIE